MIPEFDRFPVYYYTNHHAVVGPGDLALRPRFRILPAFGHEAAIDQDHAAVCEQRRREHPIAGTRFLHIRPERRWDGVDQRFVGVVEPRRQRDAVILQRVRVKL